MKRLRRPNRHNGLRSRRTTGRPSRRPALVTPLLVTPLLVTALLVTSLLVITGCSGCTDSSSSPAEGNAANAKTISQRQSDLLAYAVENLNRLEEFNTGEMLREVSTRLGQLALSEQPLSDLKGDPLLETWPEPEMLRQIVNRLNQWISLQDPPADWKPDPLVATLPEPLKELPPVRDLGQMHFARYDGFDLRQTVWLRDASRWACGDELAEVDRAKRLFDWTVRNVQLEANTPNWIPQVPWETLFFGRGTPEERAWVFILLARQQGIDAAVLALTDAEDPQSQSMQPWAVAVLSDGQLYLFDPALGLPIPAPDGIHLDDAGQLDIRPATLAQVIQDDALLHQLDVDPRRRYPVESSDLKRVVALVEGSATYLASRMQLLESHLTGRRKMALTTAPTQLAERLKASPHVTDARLWTLPYATILQRSRLDPRQVQRRLVELMPFYSVASAPLRKGRMLHLKGKFTGPEGATRAYQDARPSNRDVAETRERMASELFDLLCESNPQGSEQKLRRLADIEARTRTSFLLRAKQDASYWLGLIAFDRANDASAIDYLLTRTLEASPGGPWDHGAKYNLARTYEASDQHEKAELLYNSDTTSPAYHGNVLRARWLEAQRQGNQAAPPETDRPGPEIPEPEVPEPEVPEPEIDAPEPEADPPEPQQ